MIQSLRAPLLALLLASPLAQAGDEEVTEPGAPPSPRGDASPSSPGALRDSALTSRIITGTMLREWGVTTLPDAFRYVPGMDVYQLNGFTHAVGQRGIDDEFHPRLHVYLDGRLINVAEFGGVDWESIPVSIADIDHIEVIRGVGIPGEAGLSPSGSIRIVTRRARGTPTLTYSGYAGSHRLQSHFGRLAGSLGPVWGKAALEYRADNGLAGTAPSGALYPPRRLDDGQQLLKLNLAGGWDMTERSGWTLRLSGLDGSVEETGTDPISNGKTESSNFASSIQFDTAIGEEGHLTLGYYLEDFSLKILEHPSVTDHQAGDHIDLDRLTHSVSGQLWLPLTESWAIRTRAGWKRDLLKFDRNFPRKDDQEIAHLLLGSEYRLPLGLTLGAGIHLEHDSVDGLDISPHAGIAWSPHEDHSLRLSYRVGHRKPTLSETRIAFLVPGMGLPLITGNEDLQSETLKAYEAGYHGELESLGLILDLQLYLHRLDDKITFVADGSGPPGALTFSNAAEETVQGLEIAGEWSLVDPLSLYANYTYQDSRDEVANAVLRNRPRHKGNLGCVLRFREGLLGGTTAFINLNYVSRIEQLDATGQPHTVEERFRVDVRIARKFWEDRLELALIGHNILDGETLEFRPSPGSNATGAFEAERSFIVNLTLWL